LKEEHCTREVIGNIVNMYVKYRENDPQEKKNKSGTWGLLEKSGLLELIPVEEAELKVHVVETETSAPKKTRSGSFNK